MFGFAVSLSNFIRGFFSDSSATSDVLSSLQDHGHLLHQRRKVLVFRFVDARLESLRCQDVVDLVVCFPSGECHVVLLDLLCGYSVFAMVRSLLHAHSWSRSPVVCVSTSEFADCSCPIFIHIFT